MTSSSRRRVPSRRPAQLLRRPGAAHAALHPLGCDLRYGVATQVGGGVARGGATAVCRGMSGRIAADSQQAGGQRGWPVTWLAERTCRAYLRLAYMCTVHAPTSACACVYAYAVGSPQTVTYSCTRL